MTVRAISGFTLTSVMVAVGLSGLLAVAAARLMVNQMKGFKILELIDKGDAIYKFYSNLLHDDKVWWCSLYDGAETAGGATNSALHGCVLAKKDTLGVAATCPSIGGGGEMILKGPDCSFSPRKFRHVSRSGAELDLLNFMSSSVVFMPSGGKILRESLTRTDSSGWWNVSLKWEHMGNRAVDLVFTQSFDADKWMSAPAAGKRYLPELNYPRELRVRRSANYIPDGCGGAAVTRIALHTAGRNVTCGEGLVSGDCRWRPGGCNQIVGGVVRSQSNTECSSSVAGRVSVTPTDCAAQSSVITRIGFTNCGAASAGICTPFSYPDIVPWDNVQCALDGQGKMVTYGRCDRAADVCSWADDEDGPFIVETNNSVVVTGISSGGSLECGTLMGYPAGPLLGEQGPIGEKGPDGSGPRGPPGPDWQGRAYGSPNYGVP